MADFCAQVVDAVAIRVNKLDSVGREVFGAGQLYVADESVISIGVKPVITQGATSEQKNGVGRVCGRKRSDNSWGQVDYSLQVCSLEPELWEILLGGTVLTSGVDSIGWSSPDPSDVAPFGTSWEFWSAAWDGEQQLVRAGANQYWRMGSNKVKWEVGDFTVQEGVNVVTLNGTGLPNPNLGRGAENDHPANGVPYEGPFWYFLDVAPPAGVCGSQVQVS